MVLVVLTTLMISFVAIYAQIVTTQTARLYNAQNAFVQTMLTWHAAAATWVHNTPPTFSTTGCFAYLPTGFTKPSNFPAACTPVMTTANLPSGYLTANYSFYSMAFQSIAGGNYILTFVCTTYPAVGAASVAACVTDSASGFIALPGGGTTSAVSGFLPGDLMSQLKRAAPFDAAYGSVTSSGTFTQLVAGNNPSFTTPITYSIPPSIPNNAVGIISPAN